MKTQTALLKPRSAKTNRGEDTRQQILDAALPLLCQRWASEIRWLRALEGLDENSPDPDFIDLGQ